MYSKHLFHFALVHDEFAKTGDLISGLMPLFSPLLAELEDTVFDQDKFRKSIEESYGISFHPFIAEDIAERLAEKEILKPLGQNHRNLPKQYAISKVPQISDRKLESEIKYIYESFEKYANKVIDKQNFNLPELDLNYEFSRRLARVNLEPHHVKASDKLCRLLDWCFAKFVALIDEKGGSLQSSLRKAYSGAVLAEVVLSIKEPSVNKRDLVGKSFYIDAPILLNILGFNDQYAVNCSRELIKEIKELGGILTTTESYIKEAKVSLNAALNNHEQRGVRHSALDHFIFKNPDKLADVRLSVVQIEAKLEDVYEFNLAHKFTAIRNHVISQRAKALNTKISEALNWYTKDNARENDSEAITFVVANHGYNSIKNIAESNSFLVSPNHSMISSANNCLYKSSTFNKPEMTPLLSERKLAILLWVINGGRTAEVASHTLISACNRAMEMHQELFLNIEKFLGNIKQEDIAQYEELMTNDRLLFCLIDQTGCDADVLNEDNFESYYRDARREYEDEFKSFKEAQKKEVESVKKRLDELQVAKNKATTAVIEKAKDADEQKDLAKKLEGIIVERNEKEKELVDQNKRLIERIDMLEKNELRREQKKIKDIKEAKIRQIEKLKNQKDKEKEIIKNIEKKLSIAFQIIIISSIFYAVYVIQNKEKITAFDFEFNQSLISTLIVLISASFTWIVPNIIYTPTILFLSKKIANYLVKPLID